MSRVVITGLGVISCLGNNQEEVLKSLKNGASGLSINQDYVDNGMRCHVSGQVSPDLETIDRKMLRFMSETSAYAFLAAEEAISDSNLTSERIESTDVGVIVGSGTGSSREIQRIMDTIREKGMKRIGPYSVTRTMGNTTSAAISTFFKTKGISFSIASACSTSLHCISYGFELIKSGKQNIVIAGGSEDDHWSGSIMFDAMGALSTKNNETPQKSSKPYDKNRDGFIPSGGGGIVILEDYDSAKKRGAKIYGEIISCSETSDGYSLVSPSGEGAVRCMAGLEGIDKVDYINTHGTSTPVGDITELKAIKEVFGDNIPAISSTKSLTGHSLGAAGVHEVIYSLLMMQNNFLCGSHNIEDIDPEAEDYPILRNNEDREINCFLSNSFGFGGTNGSIIIKKI
ncbi:MAG: beta-ketoacyl-[acyl-carrier-protein] synthase I [Gammaproteobacteria bacterium]|nr:beta-ketoacyl-[acyl-carrier-protein] synthase I [Gammaproteobacteria bacterium]